MNVTNYPLDSVSIVSVFIYNLYYLTHQCLIAFYSVVAQNSEGVAADRLEWYQLNREAQKKINKELGLGNNAFANVVNVTNKIKKADSLRRKSMDEKDKSTDWLGILQDSSFHNGVTMHIFSKDQIILLAGLMKSRQLILYYDSTGGILQISRSDFGTSKHLLHSMVSFAPAEFFLKEEDYKFSSKLFNAFVVAEHISHDQSGLCHGKFIGHIMTACRSVDEECGTPLLVNTDHDGALQNGWITGCRRSDTQVTNRIMWANVVTPVLLWYEHLVDINATFNVCG